MDQSTVVSDLIKPGSHAWVWHFLHLMQACSKGATQMAEMQCQKDILGRTSREDITILQNKKHEVQTEVVKPFVEALSHCACSDQHTVRCKLQLHVCLHA